MTIRVLMFAALAQRAGVREATLELADGASVGAALAAVSARHPAIGEFAGKLATAVNMAYVKPDHVLAEGDELALIPPVSGG
jgi:molybdopterin converting factor subunit 1